MSSTSFETARGLMYAFADAGSGKGCSNRHSTADGDSDSGSPRDGNAHRGGQERPRPESNGPDSRPAVAVAVPAPLYTSVVACAAGDSPVGRERIDWRGLYDAIAVRQPLRRAMALVDSPPTARRPGQERFCRYIQPAGWDIVVASEEIAGFHGHHRPSDIWLDYWLYVEYEFGKAQTDIVIATHSAHAASTLAKLLSRGVRVTIVGLLGFFDPLLMELQEDSPALCTVLDLELDLGAVELPRRWWSSESVPHRQQLSNRP